jgi:hypothetical protein
MNVNQKGVKGLIKVIDKLTDQGFYVFPAFDDHSPIDLIAVDSNGVVYRLQVKYRKRDSRKKAIRYCIEGCSVVNGKKVKIDRNMIDGWAVYLADDEKIAFYHKSEMDGKDRITINPDNINGKLDEWLKSASC